MIFDFRLCNSYLLGIILVYVLIIYIKDILYVACTAYCGYE